jgi:hypothetical protein
MPVDGFYPDLIPVFIQAKRVVKTWLKVIFERGHWVASCVNGSVWGCGSYGGLHLRRPEMTRMMQPRRFVQ